MVGYRNEKESERRIGNEVDGVDSVRYQES